LFFLPFLFFLKHPHPLPHQHKNPSFFTPYKQIIPTFKHINHYNPPFIFIIPFFFMNDPFHTAIPIIPLYPKIIIAFTPAQFILLYLLSTISTIIPSFLFPYITKPIAANRSITLLYLILILPL
ncbi:MFS transporter, partial [Bacillus pumilus]|uniref:MFS transporter n=1 Tax=Bacillus pumilus TaxID=1408 RepID=UPI00164327BB